VKAGHAQEAITGYFDKVIASYQKRYADDKRHIYCGHDQAETLLYMVQSANNREDAVALTPTWAEAWYHKSYALTELHRNAEALSALDKAIALSPSRARYLSERGYLYHQVKDWQHSLEMYKAAEEGVKLISDRQVQIVEHTRALRGQGYALVEMGDLDAGEKKYQQSLALNPGDTMSKQELDYIKGLRAKRKP
jgi:tetratricopeptide (TPR) repeat protein